MRKFNTNLVEFVTTDNLLLPGLLFTPIQSTNKVAIFLHGNGSSSVFYSVKRAHALAKSFCSQGIALLMFNNRGAHYIKKLPKVNSERNEVGDILLGTSFELIKECVFDINGAINFLEQKSFNQFFLIGHSTGANKICVYDHYQPNNIFDKYVLLSGGDDTGLLYQESKNLKEFQQLLGKVKQMIDQKRGREFMPSIESRSMISYQSFYDVANPDGDYNCFPFTEYFGKQLSSKPMFRYFTAIKKPSLVIYGEDDEYVPEKSGKKAIEALLTQVKDKDNYEFQLIDDADHGFHDKEKELGESIVDWLKD